jgi:hypothetical protein
MNDTNEPASGNFMDRLRESPRTVSAVIIILIVAAAIYAFSGNPKQEQPPAGSLAENGTVTATTEPSPSTEQSAQPSPKATAGKAVASPMPEARKTDKGYVEVAQKGEGVTKLARRAAAQYLAENKADYEVTKAHSVYIEDYIRKHSGANRHLSIGESHEISFDLIKEAVSSAKSLSPHQLQNLQKYVSRIP